MPRPRDIVTALLAIATGVVAGILTHHPTPAPTTAGHGSTAHAPKPPVDATPDPGFAAVLQLATRLESANASQLAAIAAAESPSPYAPFRWPLIFYRWLHIDRPAALAFANPDDPVHRDALLEAAAWHDLATAPDIAPPPHLHLADIAAAHTVNGSLSLDNAVDLLPDDRTRTRLFNAIVTLRVARSPDDALAWVTSLADSKTRRSALGALARHSSHHPQLLASLVPLLADLPPSLRSGNLLTFQFRRWAETDPDTALAWAETVQPPSLRHRLLDGLDPSHDPVTRAIDARFAAGDATAALALYADNAHRRPLDTVMTSWAKHDPAAATRWLAAGPFNHTEGVFPYVLNHWFKRSPDQAFDYVTGLVPEVFTAAELRQASAPTDTTSGSGPSLSETHQDRLFRFEHAVAVATTSSPHQVIDWIDTLTDSAKPHTARLAVRALSTPELALEAVDRGGPGTLDSRTTAWIAGRWAFTDPGAASTWLTSLGQEIDSHEAYRQVAEHWTEHHPDRASEWVSSLAQGSRRDSAIGGMVDTMLRTAEPDLERAAAWADTISDPGSRANALEAVRRTADR